MRILVFSTAYDPLIGGAEIALKEVAERLPGHSFDILTSRHSKKLPFYENRGHLRIYRLGPGFSWDKHLFILLAPIFAWRLHLRNKFDLHWAIMANQAGLAALIFRFFTKLPYLLTLQEGDSERWVKYRQWLTLGVYGRIYRRAKTVQAISNFLAKRARRYGFPGQLRVVPNGLDAKIFKPLGGTDPSRAELRRMLGLPDGKIVVTSSRLVEKNAVEDLVKAVALTSDIFLLVVGDGPLLASLQRLAEKLNISGRVRFAGRVPYAHLAQFMQAADVFARPSLSEGLGSAFLEAMSCGLPVVATPVGGIPDIVTDEFNGLFCESRNPADLAEKITRLFNDNALYRRLSKNAVNFSANFEWPKISQEIDEVLRATVQRTQNILLATGIFPPDIGGPATYTAKLAPVLAGQGWGVGVVTYVDKISDESTGIVNNIYPVYRIKRSANKIWQYSCYFWRIFWTLPYYDKVYLQDLVTAGLPTWLACKLRRKKYFLKIVGDYAWEQGVWRFGVKELLDDFNPGQYGLAVGLMARLQKLVAGSAAQIITPSEYLKKIVLSWQINTPVTVVYNSVDLEGSYDKHAIRSELGLTGPVLVSVGRMVAWKGFDTLIKLVPILREKHPNLCLIVVGSGPDRQRLIDLVAQRGLDGQVSIISGLLPPETRKYIAAADVFILNSGYEGFSHALLEALALGTPTVASKIGGNPEIIEHGVSGLLVDYNDEEEIKRSISELLTDEQKREQLARYGKNLVENKFNFKTMVEQTVDILQTR